MGKYTLWLNEVGIKDLMLVGGKNASLGEMLSNINKLNVKIPNGFVVTTKCYDEFMKINKLEDKIENILNNMDVKDLESLKRSSIAIKTEIINGKFPILMKKEILEYYHNLSLQYNDLQEYIDVAVRSSGTSEDLPEASFAGQQDTYLNVRGDLLLLEKIKSCFASLFNERAISYRETMKLNNLKLSVCVQKMVRSDLGSAGVAFSLDTESGFKDVTIINGAWGLGELVVSGQVKPDEFIVFKPTQDQYNSIIDKKLGIKNKKLIYADSSDKRVKLIANETCKVNQFCLDDIKIMQLARWVSKIEDYYSNYYKRWCPVDVEWALDGLTNEIYIVQARPETVISNKKSFDLLEYKINKSEKNKLIISGVAVGDSISSGKVKIMYNINNSKEIFNDGDILVTENTDPDWEPIMKKASAIITEKGGRTCHAAIVARELGITAIVGSLDCTKKLSNGQEITVSCAEGDIGFVYEGKVNYNIIKTDLNKLPKIKTKLMMNVASPDMAFRFSKIPNSGVGLAREEFIINNFIKVHPLALLNYSSLSDENLKTEINKLTAGFKSPISYYVKKLAYGIGRIASAFYPNDAIVRFSDFKSNEYSNLLGGKDYEPKEENPMIGWRGASRYYSENFKEAFILECKAIKMARESMGLKNIIVMIPFCRTPLECEKVLNVMAENGLERGVNGLKVYLMCEIPSNVILAEEFCKYVDGFSIGSNDLTQLILGLDRDSELVADIYDERNPAVKEMLSKVIKICKKNKKKIGICGQGPSDYPDFAEFLIEQGIDTISLTPDSVIKTIRTIHKFEQKK